ncbi:MAG TPA: lipocalin family protein [Syntrophorhabdaceae bacterium]|nr:lipocalin family protein [Syntrophorhabdaceae bacterium]
MRLNALVAAWATFLMPLALPIMRLWPNVSPLTVVPEVDLARYMGTWYEIARLPTRFEEGCVAARAKYNLRQDGRVEIINACRLNSFDGRVKTVRGIARVVDKKTNARLKVSFFWPFYGKYWIIDLGKDYEYAVVGNPRRNYLWILSRRPEMDDGLYQLLLKSLAAKGYDTSRMIKTPQITEDSSPDQKEHIGG